MLSEEDVKNRCEVLKEMSIDLDMDPVVNGLASLTKKLAEIQKLRNRVAKAMGEAIRNKSEAEIAKSSIENQMGAVMSKLMMNDDYVRGQKSQDMRELAAQTKMPELVLQKHQKEVDLIRAEAYEKFVKHIHDNLEAANNNLSRQVSVVQMSVQIGEIDRPDMPGDVKIKHATQQSN